MVVTEGTEIYPDRSIRIRGQPNSKSVRREISYLVAVTRSKKRERKNNRSKSPFIRPSWASHRAGKGGPGRQARLGLREAGGYDVV